MVAKVRLGNLCSYVTHAVYLVLPLVPKLPLGDGLFTSGTQPSSSVCLHP